MSLYVHSCWALQIQRLTKQVKTISKLLYKCMKYYKPSVSSTEKGCKPMLGSAPRGPHQPACLDIHLAQPITPVDQKTRVPAMESPTYPPFLIRLRCSSHFFSALSVGHWWTNSSITSHPLNLLFLIGSIAGTFGTTRLRYVQPRVTYNTSLPLTTTIPLRSLLVHLADLSHTYHCPTPSTPATIVTPPSPPSDGRLSHLPCPMHP
jgi:hypothetical protein